MSQFNREHELTIQLEDALFDAVNMAKLTNEFLNRALGFDERHKPPIDEADAQLLIWACCKTSAMTERCQDLFRSVDVAKAAALRSAPAEDEHS